MAVTGPDDATIIYADNPSDTEEIAKILAEETPDSNRVDSDIAL